MLLYKCTVYCLYCLNRYKQYRVDSGEERAFNKLPHSRGYFEFDISVCPHCDMIMFYNVESNKLLRRLNSVTLGFKTLSQAQVKHIRGVELIQS